MINPEKLPDGHNHKRNMQETNSEGVDKTNPYGNEELTAKFPRPTHSKNPYSIAIWRARNEEEVERKSIHNLHPYKRKYAQTKDD